MTDRRSRIEAALTAQFSPSHLVVLDESHRHAGGPSAESHFNVVIVAAAFSNLRPIARHRAVFAAVEAERVAGMHALTLKALSPNEVEGAPPEALDNASPACRGGS